MATKHFFKTLLVFTLMIAIGLLGVFLVNNFEKNTGAQSSSLNKLKNKPPVAK